MQTYTLKTIVRRAEPIANEFNEEKQHSFRIRAPTEEQARRAVIESALFGGLVVSYFASVTKDPSHG